MVSVGAANSVASAPVQERSLLVRGSAGAAGELTSRDEAVRTAVREAFAASAPGGTEVEVVAAGYATGRQLSGDTGEATGGEDGLVFASIVFAERLDEHADLVAASGRSRAGNRPRPPSRRRWPRCSGPRSATGSR